MSKCALILQSFFNSTFYIPAFEALFHIQKELQTNTTIPTAYVLDMECPSEAPQTVPILTARRSYVGRGSKYWLQLCFK